MCAFTSYKCVYEEIVSIVTAYPGINQNQLSRKVKKDSWLQFNRQLNNAISDGKIVHIKYYTQYKFYPPTPEFIARELLQKKIRAKEYALAQLKKELESLSNPPSADTPSH